MLRSLDGLQFIKGHTNRFEIQLSTQSEMIEMTFYRQALQFENGIQNGEYVVVLCDDTTNRRLTQGSILLERFMEDLHRPSFLIGR